MNTTFSPLRRRWILLALAVLVLAPVATYAAPVHAQGTPGCPILITMFDSLAVRSRPAFSTITVWLTADEQVCLVGRNSSTTWVQIARPATDGALGWGPASAFTATVPLTTLPVTDGSAPTTPPTTGQTYVVQAGDTLFGIAQHFGITLTTLAQANNVQPPYYVIYVGQVLVIPGTGSPTTPPGYQQYVVKQGDYLVSIARQYNLHWSTLAVANGIQFPYVIHPGQTLLIPTAS
jgi:LysM repeat protein